MLEEVTSMYVGLDVHKKYCYATVLDRQGQVLSQGRFLNTSAELDQFLRQLDGDSQVALEACGFWEPMYDQIENRGLEVTLAHPLKTRALRLHSRLCTPKPVPSGTERSQGALSFQ
jgi:hypothetical protein